MICGTNTKCQLQTIQTSQQKYEDEDLDRVILFKEIVDVLHAAWTWRTRVVHHRDHGVTISKNFSGSYRPAIFSPKLWLWWAYLCNNFALFTIFFWRQKKSKVKSRKFLPLDNARAAHKPTRGSCGGGRIILKSACGPHRGTCVRARIINCCLIEEERGEGEEKKKERKRKGKKEELVVKGKALL